MGLFGLGKKAAPSEVENAVQVGITDMLKTGDYKQKVADLEVQNEALLATMTPEMRDAATALEETIKYKDLAKRLRAEVAEKRKFLIDFDDELMFQEFGLYKPRFDFMSVDEYKREIADIRAREKEQLREINARAKQTSWTVNGNKAEGRKMVCDTTKLLFRAFNGECDEIIRKVKSSNIDASISSIEKIADTVSKLGRVMGISIPWSYVELKQDEARVSFEYAQFKEEEKERARELREQQREAAKLAKEIAEQRKKLEKERKQYQGELDKVVAQMSTASDDELALLEAKKAELEANLAEVAKAKDDVDYREANQRAGYVYIISNIGSFGEDVYKIGMTRRLDPMERVKELGDASVPFGFDVHALIFSDDAPALEAALHRHFEGEKVNKVNPRREFFHASLDEIKQVVKENYDRTVEFVDVPDAEQYRLSVKMEQAAE